MFLWRALDPKRTALLLDWIAKGLSTSRAKGSRGPVPEHPGRDSQVPIEAAGPPRPPRRP